MKDIKRSEIYYADLNPVKGSEQGGVRPVLILQNGWSISVLPFPGYRLLYNSSSSSRNPNYSL